MPASDTLAISFDVDFAEAIAAAVSRAVVLPEAYYGLLQGVARARAVSIAGLAALAQIQAVLSALNASLEKGKTFADFVTNIKPEGITLSKGRLDNIFRTNIQAAYSSGRWEQQNANKDARPYLMYDAINDSRVRPAHRAMDGFIAKHDDVIWGKWYPPCGYRCRCSIIALTAKEARARGYGAQERPNVAPDEGWDYDRRASYLSGIEAARQQLLAAPASELQRAALAQLDEAAKLANQHHGL